jgi:hypothetical protein
MAAPNIVNVTTILGKTAVQAVGTSATAIVENTAASNKVFKINSLIISNIDGVNPADITVSVVRSSTSYALASTITIPADATLVVISKDTSIYLEESDSITLLASAAGDLQAVCSYEEIS